MDKQPNKLIKQQSAASPKNSSNQNILASLANAKNYPIMTLDQFKIELSQLTTLDEKFGLLRSQFSPQVDPLHLDPFQQQQQQQQQSLLSWNQLDLIITILDDIAKDTTSINEQVLHYRSEMQALVSAGATKVLTVPIMQEAYNGKHKRAGLIKRSMITLSQWGYYLIANHEKIIKPDFIKIMMNKVTSLGTFLISLKEKTNIPRLNNLLTVESMMGNITSPRAQSQQVSFPSMSVPVHNTVQLIRESEGDEEFKLQIDIDAGEDQEIQGEDAQDLMEAAIFSLFLLTLGVFQITPSQSKQQEIALISLLLPLAKISNFFDNFTSHPFSKDLSTIIVNDLPLLSMIQTDINILKPCLSGVSTLCETSITYLILNFCNESTAQISAKSKLAANSKQQIPSLSKNDKFAQTIQILLVKHLSSYLTYNKKKREQDNNFDNAKSEQLSSQIKQSAKFDEMEQLISQQSRSEEVIVGMQELETRDQQMNWLKQSQILLTLSIDCLKCLSSYQLGSFTQTLLRLIFDLFKSTLFFIKQLSLTNSDEIFDNLLNCDKLSDLVILPETECPIVHTFQIMMNLSKCEQKNLFDGFYQEFEDICRLIHLGCFERVDPKSYITAIYLTFLDEIVCCNQFVAQNNKKYVEEVNIKSNPPQIIEYLLKFYNNNYYPDSRMKDVETNDFIKTKINYKIVLQKFQQYEMRFVSTSSQRSGQNQISAVQLTNKTLIQQQAFELIAYYAVIMPIVNEVCLKYVTNAISEIKYETSQLKVYQIIKLAVVILKSGQFSNNKDYYELFVNSPTQKSNNREFKTWYLSPKCKILQSSVLQMWDSLFKRVKQHVLARYQIFKRNGQQSTRTEEINNMMGAPTEAGILGENQFEILKKFLVFGFTNFEIAALLSKQMKDFVKEVKDFEHSYEIKISIYQCRIILKDKDQRQEETLTLLYNLLKSLYEHIGVVQKNLTNIKPQSSIKRHQEETTLEQEQINKVKQIKYLVMQSVNILTNYIDFKEISDQSNLSLPSDTCENKSNFKQLDMLISSKKGFETYLTQIKKIILRYQLEMSGSILVEQLLRVFFFERRELQNLCLIHNNASNDQLLDSMGHKTLDNILNFIIDATEQMSLNAPMMVKSFVQFLYNKLVDPEQSKDGRQHIQLLRFARIITPQMIKQIKKIMIFIREKDDQIKECAKQFQIIMIKCLCSIPNTVVYKEFFTFFREIFYYHTDMDEVDFSLAIDTLKIFNQVLKHPQLTDKKKTEVSLIQKGVQITNVTDYFMFSDFSPGIILSESFKVPQESFSIALLFKINIQQIKALQQKSGGLDGSPLTMTFFQIINKGNSENYPPFSIIINILNNKLKIYDFECKFDEAWHFLLVSGDYKKRLKGGPVTKFKIYIDNLLKPVNTDKIQHSFQKNADHIFAYGCDAIDIFGGQKPNNQVSTHMTQIVNNLLFNNEFKAHNFFQGQLSLLMMFTKFEFEKHDQMKIAFQDFLVNLISNKQTVSIGTHELVTFMKAALKLNAKDKDLGTFESHEFNEQVIIKHQLGCGINHLSTQHMVKPSEILVVMGGFKALYPIFDKSLSSNLSVLQKSKIWLYLFKVLRTLMFVEPQHVLRLFKSKYLVETLRSCLVKCGLSSGFMITKELTTEVLLIAKAASNGGVLEEFFRRYIFEVVLDETICELAVIDRGRKIKMFEEVAECMYEMFIEEEKEKDKMEKWEERKSHQIGYKMLIEQEEGEKKASKYFFTQSTSEKIYQLIMRLIIRYSEAEYISQTKKLAQILMKIILRYQQKENFGKLIEAIHQSDTKKSKQLNQAALLAHLKIFEGVIKEPYFYKSTQLMQALRSQYKREVMELHLNQSSYLKQNTSSDIDVKLADNIIAVALRIIIDIQAKSQDAPAPQMPPRNVYMNTLTKSPNDEEKSFFISQLFKALKQNPKGISMQKTVCSLIIAAIEKKQKIKKTNNTYARVKYNPAFLKQILKDRQVNNILEIMRSTDFDSELFSLTIKLFKRYDLDTKLVLLDFYRQLIEEGNLLTTIESFDAFKDLKFLHLMKDLIKSNQEKYILNIVNAAIQAKEPEIVKFTIRIVASVIKCFFNTSLQIDNEGVVYEEEIRYLKSIKKLFLLLESKEDALFNVLNDVLKYVQEVVNWVWSFYLHDTNRTNLNLKLVLFLQIIEEILMKKIGKTGASAEFMGLITSQNFLEVLARLLIIFEDTKMLYFDYPNPSIVDVGKRDTNVATGMIRVKQTMLTKDTQFLEGGPLRIFISLFLQLLRKLKPSDITINTQEERKTSRKMSNSPTRSIERSLKAYNLVVEMFNYYLFKKESTFVNKQRPVSTIEPPTPEGLNQSPLFKIFKNLLNTGLNKKSQYVLQPIDLTKQFIEINTDFSDQKESIAQTPGFLPLLLINEIFDIIRRKYLQLKQLQLEEEPLKNQIIQLFGLLYDIMSQAFIFEEFSDSVGTIMIIITDARLKDEIYCNMNPRKINMRGRGGKPFLLAKAAELFLQSKSTVYQRTQQQILASSEIDIEMPAQTNNNEESLPFNMNEQHFLRRSETIDRNATSKTNQQDLIGMNDFGMVEKIRRAEEQEKQENTKDFAFYQDEVMSFITQCYQDLGEFFKKGTTTQKLSDEQLITLFRQNFIDNERITQILQSFRIVSSEKFRHVHSFSFSNREDYEIELVLNNFQVFETQETISSSGDQNHESKQPENGSPIKPINITEQPMISTVPMLSSTSSERIQKQFDNNADQVNFNIASARKRSADDTGYQNNNNNEFEFQIEAQQDFTPEDSMGKPSISSQSRSDYFQSQGLLTSQQTFRNGQRPNHSYRTLKYYYCKQQYKKTVKKLMEDPSSIWYDNLEQMKKDYADIKEIYDIIAAQTLLEEKETQKQEEEKNQLQISVNKPPAEVQLSGFKFKQYDHFVRLRRMTDLWGRMLLLKPDRQYKQRKFLVSHKYFVQDLLKKLFAVSLLEESDFQDYQDMMNSNINAQEKPQQTQKAPRSDQLKKIREQLMSKIEQNDFLYTLFTRSDLFVNEDQKFFEFQPVVDQTIIWKSDVQYITVEGAQYGDLYLSQQYLMFKSKPQRVNSDSKFSQKKDEIIKKRDKCWHIGSLEQVFKRRFILLHQACEIYTTDKKSYFFNLMSEEKANEYFARLGEVAKKHNKKNHKKIDIIENPKEQFKRRKILDDWNKGEKSTQEFLLLLNKFSGRSFNDCGQYPIFPWILSNYNSSLEDLKLIIERAGFSAEEQDLVFRDLTKNSGVLSEMKEKIAIEQLSSPIEGDAMVYGDEQYNLKFGFSNRVSVLGYLIRMEPFTDIFVKINGGLDNPDRIFYSFADQWKSLTEDKQNNYELVPEFFYLPEMFRNHNLSHLGKTRSNHSVNEVTLPSWAKNEHDFIRIHRELLESKFVAKKIRCWIDQLFGVKQKDAEYHNIFYCFAYEGYVKQNKENLEDINVDTILEFLNVPQQILSEPLWKVDKRAMPQLPMQSTQLPTNMPAIEDERVEPNHAPLTPHQRLQIQSAAITSSNPKFQRQGFSVMPPTRDKQRETEHISIMNPNIPQQQQQTKDILRNSSLIQKFIEIASQQHKRYDTELKQIQESHKIEKPEEKNIFHMAFSLLNGKCFVFLNDQSGSVKCVACRESFLQEELRNPCPLGLKLENLRGDYNNIFQLYGGGVGSQAKQPLLFTCQNLDNSIKVFDLSIKKPSQLVFQEFAHNTVVTAIKFSPDFKYFISGDMSGVINHYQKISEEVEGDAQQQDDIQNNKAFPYTLKLKYQDQYGAILGIDVNYTLDLYVTASRDGTLALRCLRTAQLLHLIPLDKLQQPSVDVLTLKLSLHGYIILMMKSNTKMLTLVYSLNGDMLVSTQRENQLFEFKYCQLTSGEAELIMVFNQRVKKEDTDMQGVIRVCRLYDMEKEFKKDNLQRTFYSIINQLIYSGGSKKEKNQKNGEGNSSSSKIMPPVVSFALSQDENKMNLYLRTGEIICFDESRSQIIEQLDDFGLA